MPQFEHNFTENQLNLISDGGTSAASFDKDGGTDYIRMSVFDQNGNYTNRQFFSNQDITGQNGVSQIKIYENAAYEIFVKPNDILDLNGVPSGNYTLQFDFLRNVFTPTAESVYFDGLTNPRFYVKEISPSRKEVRLLGISATSTELFFGSDNESNDFISEFNSSFGEFDYNWVLSVSSGRNLTIVGKEFDNTSDSTNYSLVLRLNQPLPNDINKLDECHVQKELLVTQTQNVMYVSNIASVNIGSPLTPDTSNPDASDNNSYFGSETLQNKNQLLISASLSEDIYGDILYSLKDKDKNLNIDYNDFKNHIHFGSATQKLKNFKQKVIEINEYLGKISSSLNYTGSQNASSIVEDRKNTFESIRNIKENFTPYERFLYADGQSQTTSSAPGIGNNYVKSYAINEVVGLDDVGTDIASSKLPQFEGFNGVYKVDTSTLNSDTASVFDNKYLADQSPFFNYSGSVFLSFIMRSDSALEFTTENTTNYGGVPLPEHSTGDTIGAPHYKAHIIGSGSASGINDFATSSKYIRYVYEASQSHWRPKSQGSGVISEVQTASIAFADIQSADLTATSDIQILSRVEEGYNELSHDYLVWSSSIAIQDTSGLYGDLLSPSMRDDDGLLDGDAYRKASFVLPAGDLFPMRLTSSALFNSFSDTPVVGESAGFSSSFITDIKITKNNPTASLPFSQIYHTGSNEWKDWYSGSYDSASAYDEINIHSLENNLPSFIRSGNEYDDLKVFLSMIGENFDHIRNYIDNYSSFYSKSYKNYNESGSKKLTIPDEILPMIASNLGWKFINPYTGSLEGYFSDISEGGDNLKNIKSETWRKVLNNLMYIYKTKGTLNSLNGLLNTYGYPHEAMGIQELGGSTQEINPVKITNEIKTLKSGFLNQTENIHAVKNINLFHSLNLSGEDKKLHLDWHTNGTSGDTIEFVFKTSNSSSANQIILENSGSGAEQATGSLFVKTNNPLEISGSTLVISSSDGTGKTYTLDGTASFNVSNTPIIGLGGLTDSSSIAQRISESIGHSSGHNGKIISQYHQFVSGSGGDAFFVSSSDRFAVTRTDGILSLIQTLSGSDGNKAIISNANTTYFSASGFDSGTDSQTLWDLRLIPSSSNTTGSSTGSLEFRINNSFNGTGSIITNKISMSTDNLPLSNGKLWNVMVQRMTQSITTAQSQSYRLYVGLQDSDKIEYFTTASMTIANTLTSSGQYVNSNFVGTGSLGTAPGSASSNVSGNLVVGRSITGSMGEFRVWNQVLSASKFKQHILNKFSTVGNNLSSSIDNIIYRFRLNENYASASSTDNIVDANPYGPLTSPKDYTRDIGFVSASYFINNIVSIGFSMRIDANKQNNIVKGLIEPEKYYTRNLSPIHRSSLTVYEPQGYEKKPKRSITNKIEIHHSLNQSIDDYIINQFSDIDISGMIADPQNRYSSSYSELDSFREKAFRGIKVDANAFIDAQSQIFNDAITDNIQQLLPASSTIDSVGVMIKPTILERSKHVYHNPQLFYGPGSGIGLYESNTLNYYFENSGSVSGSHNRDLYLFDMTNSEFITPYTNLNPLQFYYENSGSTIYNLSQSEYFKPYEVIEPVALRIRNSGSYYYTFSGSEYVQPYNLIEPVYIRDKGTGSGVFDLGGSELYQPYNVIDPLQFRDSNGNTGSYYYTFTGSEYVQPYLPIESIKFNGDSGSGVYNFTGSNYMPPYLPIESIKFNGDSGSYFHVTTGSKYFSHYDMMNPLYIRDKGTGSGVFDLSGSEFLDNFYLPIESIKFNGDSGSYIHLTTGSKYFNQYNLIEPVYIRDKGTGSGVFDLSDGEYISSDKYPVNDLTINYENSGSTILSLSGSELFIPVTGSNREIADVSGLFGGIRRDRNGTPFGTRSPDGQWNSYIWNAWGTGSDDIWFMNGTESNGYYNQEFVYEVIGDIEIWSSSMNVTNTNSELEFMNPNTFRNQKIVQKGQGFKYRGYSNRAGGSWPNIDSSSAEGAFIDGRAMGRTHYFTTASDGTILYPPNHYIVAKTSKTDMRAFYIGSLEQHGESGTSTTFYDPLGIDPNPKGQVSVVSVQGAQTDQSIVVVSQGGLTRGTGSVGVK